MSKHDSTRRSFLKRAAVGAGAVAGSGLVPDVYTQTLEQHKDDAADRRLASHLNSAWRLLQLRAGQHCGGVYRTPHARSAREAGSARRGRAQLH